VPLRLYLIEH